MSSDLNKSISEDNPASSILTNSDGDLASPSTSDHSTNKDVDIIKDNFSINTDGSRKCNKCSKILSSNTSTTNLKEHLKRKHNVGNNKFKESEKSAKINTLFKPKLTKRKEATITQVITQWLTEDMIEPNKVMLSGFHKLIEYFEPDYVLPHRSTFQRNYIPAEYNALKSKIKEMMSSCNSRMALTTDMWTDNYRRKSYITVTTHFISKWELKSFVLETREFLSQKTGENIKDYLKDVISEWNIKDPIITSDNGTNILKAISLLGCPGIKCVAHTLNLIVNDSLKNVEGVSALIEKLRQIVHTFKFQNRRIEDKQKELLEKMKTCLDGDIFENGEEIGDGNIKTTTIKKDVQTRWNSLLIMSRSIMENNIVIRSLLIEDEKFSLLLTDAEVKKIKDLVEFLENFEKATEILGGENYPCLSLWVPAIFRLKSVCDPESENISNNSDADFLRQLKFSFFMELDRRYPTYPQLGLQATCLDKRFQTFVLSPRFPCLLSPKELLMESLSLLPKDLECESERDFGSADSSHSETKKSKFSDFFDDLISQPLENNVTTEVDRFLSLPALTSKELEKFNLLTWWEMHEQTFPMLSKLAASLLCVPATSIPSERIFSCSGNIVTQKRSSLKPENVDKLVFLFNNKKHI